MTPNSQKSARQRGYVPDATCQQEGCQRTARRARNDHGDTQASGHRVASRLEQTGNHRLTIEGRRETSGGRGRAVRMAQNSQGLAGRVTKRCRRIARSTPSGWGDTKQPGNRCTARRKPVTRTMSDSLGEVLADRRTQKSEKCAKQPAGY